MTGTVLVVDDDPDTRDVLALALSMEGYNVRVAESRLAAVSMLSGELGAVLLDYNMPGMTPGEFVLRVRQSYPDLCIILMSAADKIAALAHALALQYWIAKPFDFDDLNGILRTCMQPTPKA
jgi:CheY-like chemotaxis protein